MKIQNLYKLDSRDMIDFLFHGFDGVSQRLHVRVNDLTQGSTLRCSNFHSYLMFVFDVPAWIILTVLSHSIFKSPVMMTQRNF